MATMSRADFARGLQDGLNAVFGLNYTRFPQEWPAIFDRMTSRKAFEEQVLQVGLGAAQLKGEGSGVAYDSGRMVWSVRYVHQTFALAFDITEEAIEDHLYGDLGADYSKSLALSMQHTKEINGANILNFGFDTSGSYNGGDGVPLYSTAHPLANGDTYANKLSTAADLAEESLEDLCILIEGFTDDRNIPMSAMPIRLIIPHQQRFTADKLMNSQFTPFSSDNAVNAVKDMFNSKPAINHRLTDPDAFHCKTNVSKGLQHFARTPIKRGTEGDFNTGNTRYKARERYVFGWSDPRGVAGSEGSG